jgi:hypothetical protein
MFDILEQRKFFVSLKNKSKARLLALLHLQAAGRRPEDVIPRKRDSNWSFEL